MLKILTNKKIILVLLFFVLFVIFFKLNQEIINHFVNYLNDISVNMITIAPHEYFGEILKLTIISLIIIFLPLILFIIYKNLKDALLEKEKKIINYLPIVIIFATIGLGIGLLISTKYFLPYFSNFQLGSGIESLRTLHAIVGFLIWISASFAILLQVPLILYLLIKHNIVKIERFIKQKKIIIIGTMIISAIITPPDAISLLIIFVFIYLLFEITLLIIRKKLKGKITNT